LPSWQLNHQSRITEPPLVEEEEETAVAEDTLAVAEIAGEEAINKEVVETVVAEDTQVVAVEGEVVEEMTQMKAL